MARTDAKTAVDGEPGPHDWRPADADTGTEVRRLGPDRYQLHHPDGTVEDLSSAAFDRWRDRGGDPDD